MFGRRYGENRGAWRPSSSGVVFVVFCGLLGPVLAKLESYTEPQVLRFLNRSAALDVSDSCKDSLGKVFAYLKDHDTLDVQRSYYHESFATGDTDEFESRDQDRWVYRGYKCILAAGETDYSESEHPMHYCYAYDTETGKRGSEAYSVCIPSTCSNDYIKLLTEWQSESSTKRIKTSLNSEIVGCTRSRHEKQWYEQFIPMTDLVFNILLVLLVALATVFHHKRGESGKSIPARILLSWSAKKNFAKLIEMPKDPQSTITCMFGMRFLSMVWTLIGHSFIFIQTFMINVDEYKDDLVNNFGNQWITNFTLSVDTFFLLSGTLLAYSWFRKWQKNTTEPEPTITSWAYWLRFYRHRFESPRGKTSLQADSSLAGLPLHGRGGDLPRLGHPLPPDVACHRSGCAMPEMVVEQRSLHQFPHGESMHALDLVHRHRVHLLRGLAHLPARSSSSAEVRPCPLSRHNRRLGWSQYGKSALFASRPFQVSMVLNNFPPTQLLWRQPPIFNPNFIQHHLELYIKPQYRIGPYVIGLLLGYYLAIYQKLVQKSARSLQFVIIGWSFSALCIGWAIFGLYPALQGYDWPVYHLVYGSIHRDIFAVGLAWLLYACHTGIGGPVNAILSFKALLPLSALCYSVYLFHMIPIVLTFLLVEFPIVYTTKWIIFVHCLAQLLVSYFFGIICTMVAELPALNLEKIFLYGGCPKKKAALQPAGVPEAEMQLRAPETAKVLPNA